MASSRTPPSLLIFVCAILAVHLVLAQSSSAVDISGGQQLSQLSWDSMGTSAAGLMAGDNDLELQMDSEINRRILQTAQRYISYGALRRNTVPCSRRGASYYNCRPGGSANPYRRGCSSIARCRG